MRERAPHPDIAHESNPDWTHQHFELVDSILVGVGPDSRVRRVNRKGCEALGYPLGEMVGRNWFDDFVPARVRGRARQVFNLFRDGAREAPEHCETPILCRDGSERIIAWRNAVLLDEAGQIVEVVASGEDVTDKRRAEADLRASETRFRATFEQAAVGMAHVGPGGRFLRLNRKLCEITGYDRAELRARTFQDITHPDDLEADLSQARALHAGDIPFYSMEKRYIRKDGSTVWVNLTGSVVRDAQGKPDYFIAVVEDIGLRKQAEALRSNEALQRMALSAANAGAWEWYPETGAQVWSPETYNLYGLDPNREPPGFDEWLARCVVPEDRAKVQACRHGAGNDAGEYRLEFRSRHPGKGLRWVRVDGRLVRDGDGAAPRAYGISVDITDRRRADEALRDSEERVRMAMAAADIGVWDWDIASGSVGWSDNLARLAGMVPGMVAGGIEAFRALVHPEDRPGIDDALDAALSGRSELNVEFRMIRLDGGLRWLATRAIVLRDPSGRPVRMVGIDRDITGRKEAEERQQRLASELDHRVRNIVAVIGAIASQTLAAGPERKALLGRLNALANAHRLLTASQWESVDVAALVRQELAPYPADRVACDGPPLAVPSRIAQTLALVLHELATNAAKYGALSVPTGRVDTRWSVRAADKPVLELIWSESGGAPVKAPLKRGFGTRLIERSAASEGGKAELMFRPEGLQMRLTIPLQRGMA